MSWHISPSVFQGIGIDLKYMKENHSHFNYSSFFFYYTQEESQIRAFSGEFL